MVQLVSRSPVESCLDSDPQPKPSNHNSEEADIFPSAHNATIQVYFRCKLPRVWFAHVSTVAVVFNVVPYIVLVDTGIECPRRWLGI